MVDLQIKQAMSDFYIDIPRLRGQRVSYVTNFKPLKTYLEQELFTQNNKRIIHSCQIKIHSQHH
jgi:hypothetical protein